jgi:hypothetical protein
VWTTNKKKKQNKIQAVYHKQLPVQTSQTYSNYTAVKKVNVDHYTITREAVAKNYSHLTDKHMYDPFINGLFKANSN